jgi:hypothetical protein
MKQTKHIRAQSSLINSKKTYDLASCMLKNNNQIKEKSSENILESTKDADETRSFSTDELELKQVLFKLERLTEQNKKLNERINALETERLEYKKEKIMIKGNKSLDDNLKYYISYLIQQEKESTDQHIKEMNSKIDSLQDNILNTIEENNAVNKLELQHSYNQIKRLENNIEDVISLVESNQAYKKKDSKPVNHKTSEVSEFSQVEPIINIEFSNNTSLMEDYKLEKMEDMLKKYFKTERIIEEILRQIISIKKNYHTLNEDSFKKLEANKIEIQKLKERMSNQHMINISEIERIKFKLDRLTDNSKIVNSIVDTLNHNQININSLKNDMKEVQFGLSSTMSEIDKIYKEEDSIKNNFNKEIILNESKLVYVLK